MSLINDLRKWRTEQARVEGVEPYRVLTNAVLDAIAATSPETKEALLGIKGIKEARFQKYGKTLLAMVKASLVSGTGEILSEQKEEESFDIASLEASAPEEPLSVSSFLDALNIELSGMAARIRGEVSSVDIRDRVVYFTLKDSTDESALNCLIFRYQYEVSGVALAVGDEIVVEGVPEIYKPTGRMSLKVGVIELFGEGALKKAYDALYKKLETEGVFAPEKKRTLPEFPERIALITSREGAAIDDFKMNLGNFGFRVTFFPTSVEGKKAVFEILQAIRYFNKHPERYDCLVIIRGGGSLESLQAFNNESLVREVAESRIPTLLGVGHEKDVTLAALAADVMVSTPTATAKLLAHPWNEARQLASHFEKHLPLLFQERLSNTQRNVNRDTETLLGYLRLIRERVTECEQDIARHLALTLEYVRQKRSELETAREKLKQSFQFLSSRVAKALESLEARLLQYDPQRVLRLGYSLIKKGNTVLKDASQAKIGDILDIQLGKGGLSAEVKKITE
ncbi:MAG: exodeoxyribonuclease VII large subunit [Candidatus Moranbacteria bacterium RIFCSPHIGHO2_01_FULL_55_24]|nr:MAG: exodeoxyribonuclease VII large subunit [Candidatus Moranbacteria bacterium RIFCSPHIGHO2_01_FULL_55_24]